MNHKEIEVVIALPAAERYAYFIKKVVDFEEVWGLYEDGWAVSEDTGGNSLLPFWPRKEFASLCATGEWKGYKAKRIEIDEFIHEWLPGMRVDGVRPSIFLNHHDSAVVEIEVLLSDLEEELMKY